MTTDTIAIDGVTSFTGFWFAQALAQHDFHVVAFCQKSRSDYTDLKAERLKRLPASVELIDNAPFGSTRHLDALTALKELSVYGRHGAYTENYKSDDFLLMKAVEENTRALPQALAILAKHGAKLCLTGSVFQQNAGVAYPDGRAFSPYGLSKTLTEEIISYHTAKANIPLGIFMIANPFGPWEEARFTSYLAKSWLAGQTPNVQAPLYVRDNIPIDLLARTYADYVARLAANVQLPRFGPSCYAESQGQFTARFADAMRPRLNVPCAFTCAEKIVLTEPLLRLNTHALDASQYQWNEAQSWDALANHYRERFQA